LCSAQLLERMPRGVRLIEAGRVLLGHAEVILDRMAAAHSCERARLAALGKPELATA
jgi:DNA-binding transcriptional LysR family regulator